VLLLFLLILFGGGLSYALIAKEAAPDIDIPIFFVTVTYSGISPEDSERLLVRPLQTIEGVDNLVASAGEGFALIRLDFKAGFDNRRALADVRKKVDLTRADLSPGTNEPQVMEVDLSMFPVLTTTLSGSVPERTLVCTARELRDWLEAIPGVLEVVIGGDREDVLEVMVDPLTMEIYRLPYNELIAAIDRNNRLVAAGALNTGAGCVSLKVPGVIESVEDVLELPVIVSESGTVVTFGEIGTGRRTFTLEADVAAGQLADERSRALMAWLAENPPNDAVQIRFCGQAEEQLKAGQFLIAAFLFSIFLMVLILVTQFNSFHQVFLVLTAIVFSTAGVLLGLLLRREPFSVVMSGIGVIALAGIVVNNKIVLIDTLTMCCANREWRRWRRRCAPVPSDCARYC